MQQSQWEVVILKPTQVFLSFLSTQLPDIELPELRLIQTDTTAYVIPKFDDEEKTLDEIERHYTRMFSHEISRWLGEDIGNEVKASFLDFLCCFKFELHSQIVLMESSIQSGQQLLCVKPRSVLLKWIKTAIEEPDEEITTVLERVNISHLAENATVIVKNFTQLSEIKPFLEHYFRPIYKTEMYRMCDRSDYWPKVNSFQEFNRYFAVEIHTQLIQLN
ncbi:Uncharacterised protein (plasmid) [Legionella adelaidensis]|uniref:Uncharacterized protein n=1 Tax=Legionella adelaidensis TaxID=45056 RepID=A0A0W0R1H4_9GAMM|nr:hypothetical protein [Legionella adelaidensis]KTC64914.1 hypothetical protein Lade_1721 [Legionella adelaidensis]VEH85597.1 Uncharacterised protein [Legionella adelaidensis]